ncbi:hypothetical protein GCM10008090_22460 [Arenicella chitinivorans]|uniref:Uncharacterized protein n=1 Tax=Arenicella chitinivorans TaxID=1329800 RepID=A0A918RU78_9GAMM|nr:hypothetical protein GCM10008090_22460 [Arenicella chitinivorans]
MHATPTTRVIFCNDRVLIGLNHTTAHVRLHIADPTLIQPFGTVAIDNRSNTASCSYQLRSLITLGLMH